MGIRNHGGSQESITQEQILLVDPKRTVASVSTPNLSYVVLLINQLNLFAVMPKLKLILEMIVY